MYVVGEKKCLHRVSTGVETLKCCLTHATMRPTTKMETHGSARKKLTASTKKVLLKVFCDPSGVFCGTSWKVDSDKTPKCVMLC